MPEPIPALPPSWSEALGPELRQPYMQELSRFLAQRGDEGAVIYPEPALRLAALARTPLDGVRVFILGQDPYHGPGQAHGLAFSVPPGVRRPPSLRNIVRELGTDLALPDPGHGHLDHWAAQGVLLLNSVLTVEDGKPGSHAKRGWERFTRRVAEIVNERRPHVAFVLWGAYAGRLAELVDRSRHLVVASAHPSPLSARTGFFGSRPFSQVNAFLTEHGMTPVDWSLG